MSDVNPSPDDLPPPVLSYAGGFPGASMRGVGFLAVSATLFLPGLAHIYAGRWRRGATWFSISIALNILTLAVVAVPELLWGLLVVPPLIILFYLVICVDAYRVTRRSVSGMAPLSRYVVGVLLLVAFLYITPHGVVNKYIIVPLLKEHWVETFRIRGSGMAPTIVADDQVLCHKGRPFQRWSIVVYELPAAPGNKGILRVVGLPREKVAVIGGQVHINGKPQAHPPEITLYYAAAGMLPSNGWEEEIQLADDEYFLLGDNSASSYDGRYWRESPWGRQLGSIPASAIDGPVTAIYWPSARWRRLD